jgi:hypothetical protein
MENPLQSIVTLGALTVMQKPYDDRFLERAHDCVMLPQAHVDRAYVLPVRNSDTMNAIRIDFTFDIMTPPIHSNKAAAQQIYSEHWNPAKHLKT